jgi:NADH-quinone oxidoreductase subunit N
VLNLLPTLVLTAGGFLLLGLDAFGPAGRDVCMGTAAGAMVLAAVATFCAPGGGILHGMAVVDGPSRFFAVVLLCGLLLVLGMSRDFKGFRDQKKFSWGTYGALLLFSGAGLLWLVGADDFLMLLVALELIGITSFILTGFNKGEKRGSEAAMKFFLIGAFSAGLMVYGISLIYGSLGSTAFDALRNVDPAKPSALLVTGVFFLLAGLGFKMAMAPFHMWVPDTYEGAPTPITGYLSVATKAAAFGAVMRLLPNHDALRMSWVLAVLAAVTMSWGNLGALKQTNVKRLLAYSSIAQMGYVLMGFTAAGPEGFRSVLLYTTAYLFMNLGAFACVVAVTDHAGSEDADAFCGLGERSLPLALATTVFLLSLTGLPPFLGFVAKYSLFASAVAGGWMPLAVVAALNSVVSLYYYFSIVHRMFFTAPRSAEAPALSPVLTGCVTACLFVTLIVGVFPQHLVNWVKEMFP